MDSPSADSDNANEGALSASASASASPQPQSNGASNAVAVADVDAEAVEAGADSSSSSSTPITRSVALSLVTWQLFQQEKARISASMTDSMFVDWLLTHIRPSAYFQQFRAPQTAAAAVQDTGTTGEGGSGSAVAAGSVQVRPWGLRIELPVWFLLFVRLPFTAHFPPSLPLRHFLAFPLQFPPMTVKQYSYMKICSS